MLRTNLRSGINQNNNISNIILNTVIVIVSIILLIYTGYRAATLSFIIDESLSFNVFSPLSFMDIVSYKIPTANNHMINSLFLKYISQLFGTTEFLLRSPSLVSHLIYIIFSYKIIKKVSSPLIGLAGFLLLNLNPFMLDYFSLARGYAMAVSCTVVSIYFLFNYIESNKVKNLNWTFVFAMLAVLSNFCLLIFYISLVAVINLYWVASQSHFKFNALLRKNIRVFLYSFLLAVIMFEPIRKLVKYKEFYDGGTNGFWSDTVGSLMGATLYGQSYPQIVSVSLRYIIAVFSLVMIMSLAYNFYFKKWKILTEKSTVSILLLFMTCIVSIAQHFILKSLFLMNRMALFFIPLFWIPVILFFSDYARLHNWKIISNSLIIIIAMVFTFHTFHALNTSYALIWRYDADTKQMLSDLEKQVKHEDKTHVKLGVMWLFEPTVNFYRTTKKYDWLEKVTEDDYRKIHYDYYYLADSSLNFIHSRNMSVIKHYSNSNSYLVK